jgi:hypothetical protein
VLRIDGHGYSPAVLDKIVSAGADCKSFSHAAAQLEKLAEISVSQSHISNLTHEIGRELIAVRDHQAALHRHRQLPPDPGQPPIDLACVETDGGRLMTRAAEKPRGIHDKQWKEPKVGVLWRMKGETFPEDPHPELPRCFQQRESVKKLVREVHGTSSKGTDESDHGITLETITGRDEESTSRDGACQPGSGERRQWQPQRVFRTCVATLLNVYGFGPLVAAEAQRRGFYQAQRKVFLGDGQEDSDSSQRGGAIPDQSTFRTRGRNSPCPLPYGSRWASGFSGPSPYSSPGGEHGRPAPCRRYRTSV